MTKTELTLSGIVCKVEKAGRWVAFVLPTESRTKFSTKVILGGELGEEAIREGISKGTAILASGDNYKVEGNCLKLFANMCMRVDEFEKR